MVPEQERAALLAALRVVDAVTIFDEPTAVRLVEALRPDVYVKAPTTLAPDLAAWMKRGCRRRLRYAGVAGWCAWCRACRGPRPRRSSPGWQTWRGEGWTADNIGSA